MYKLRIKGLINDFRKDIKQMRCRISIYYTPTLDNYYKLKNINKLLIFFIIKAPISPINAKPVMKIVIIKVFYSMALEYI